MAKYKMILDLDTGVDDALALAYALATPECDLIGVVASFGNIVPEEAAQNTLNLLEMLGHPEVPVFIGATHSSHTDHFEVMPISQTIHGMNGVGNVELPTAKRKIESQNGIDFYIEAAHKYQGQLLIVPTGPLTNLAAAIEKDPEIIDLIGHVTLMGGALTVPGNVNPVTEANINQDPPAADQVLRMVLYGHCLQKKKLKSGVKSEQHPLPNTQISLTTTSTHTKSPVLTFTAADCMIH